MSTHAITSLLQRQGQAIAEYRHREARQYMPTFVDLTAELMDTRSVCGVAHLPVEAAMTSVRTDIGGFVIARPAHWVVDDRASIASILAAIAVCIGALSGCTNTPAQEGSRTTPSSSPQNAQAQLLALEGTVGYLHQWSQHHLVQEVRGLTDRSGPIPSEARLRALRKAIAGAVAVHLGCESVDAKLIEPVSTTIEIRANSCIYPVSATGTDTLAVARGCVILAAPTGTVDAFLKQDAQVPFGPPPILVDSRAKAGPGTWYLGPCR